MGKHLDFYYKCMGKGRMPEDGLCGCSNKGHINSSLLNIFTPTPDDEEILVEEHEGILYWACGIKLGETSRDNRVYGFTPFRQTIVLFMAAMNNEL